nr:hypothetical protein [uncultured Desulfobacter sp.]
MTTVHGHNQIFQQSGIAQDLSQQIQSPKPDPDQAAILHQTQQVEENTTVQESEEALSLKEKKEKEKKEKEKARKAKRAKKENPQAELPPDPDGPGRLLDITA